MGEENNLEREAKKVPTNHNGNWLEQMRNYSKMVKRCEKIYPSKRDTLINFKIYGIVR